MAEQDTSETTENQTPDAVEKQGDPADLGDAGKKALDAERKRAHEAEKQAKLLQAQIDALNDSKLTEAQRMQKQIDDLTARYEEAQLSALRDRIAVEENIPAGLVPYLAGKDETELRESAVSLRAAIAEAAKPGTPKPDPTQGAQGAPADASTASQFAQFFERALT